MRGAKLLAFLLLRGCGDAMKGCADMLERKRDRWSRSVGTVEIGGI